MSAREVRAVSKEEWERVLRYIYYVKSLDSGPSEGVSGQDFWDVDCLRDVNPDVDEYITLCLQLYSLEKSMKQLDNDRLRLSRRVLSLQKGFIDGFGGIFDGCS